MFLFIAILSSFFYAINGTLLSYFARKIDPLLVATIRGFSLFFWMSPLLFFIPQNYWISLPKLFPIIFLVGIIGAIGFFLFLSASKFLPLGVNSALRSAVRVILVFIIGSIFFKEKISIAQICGTILILICGGFLSAGKFDFKHLDNKKFYGIFFVILGSMGATIWWLVGTKISREFSPFIFAYFGEAAVGIGSMILFFGRKILSKKFFTSKYQTKISKKQLWQIFFISSSTLGGTGCFFVSTKLGPIGPVAAIGSAGVLFSALLGAIFFDEKLKLWHWLQILGIIVGVIFLGSPAKL